jgi:deoxyribose-phosphate aldolase
MVVNAGKVLSGDWDYVEQEISAVNKAVVDQGAILKVIFEVILGPPEVSDVLTILP